MSNVVKQVTVINKGEEAEFDVFLENETFPRSMDITSFDAFKACFITDSGTPLVVTQIANLNGSSITKVDGGTYGQLKVVLGPLDSALLKAGPGEDLEIVRDVIASPAPKHERLHRVLNIEESIC